MTSLKGQSTTCAALDDKMLRRPQCGETEQDLLACQERFLASGEKPAVALAAARGKRKQRQDERDVVQLGAGGAGTKKSRFRQQRQDRNAAVIEDPHVAMDAQDTHITNVMMADIQDRDVIDSLVSMPTRMTRHGFPSVHELDMSSPPRTSSHPHKKKSLFARHFDNHPPEYFGFEFKPSNQVTPVERDKVQPLTAPQKVSQATPTSSEGIKFASTASETWTNLLDSVPSPNPSPSSLTSLPSLISGEGLGLSRETAVAEVRKIHDENVLRLAEASREELLSERERVQQVLGPELVDFLKKRTREGTRGDMRGEGGEDRGGGKVERGGEDRGGEKVERGGEDCGGEKMERGGEKMERGGEEEEGRREDCGGGRGETDVIVPPGWLHMEEVEREKMEWMTDVLPDAESQEGESVRFSLDGLVIRRGTFLPSHHALHHHGDEPAAAGYTLTELLSLVRSAAPQQRVLSLSTLAKIIRWAWCGGYRGVVSHGVLSVLCEAGLPLLLRYAVDDSSTTVISAALTAIHSLLVPQWEEVLLQEMCTCHRGCSLPCMRASHSPPQQEGEGKAEEEEEEEDGDIMAKDVVQGYLVTGLLRRLRYILEVVRPGPTEVHLSLQIITRLSRHSLHAAAEVVNCPRLMDTIFREFLPLVWTTQNDEMKTAYGVPQPAAMRLVQVLGSASRNLTSLLLSRHKLLEVIIRYMLPHPSELSLPASHAHSLSLASLQTGRELLEYGLATEWLRDCYPVLAKHFFPLPSLSLSSLPLHEASRLAAFIWLLEPVASHPPPSLPHTLTSSLLSPLLSALPVWVEEGEGGGGEAVMERLVCVRSVLNVLASYLSRQATPTATPTAHRMEPLDVAEMAAALSSGLLVTLAGSNILHSVLTGLRQTSPLCQKSPSPLAPGENPLCPPSLPSLLTATPTATPAEYGNTSANEDYNGFLKPYIIYMSCSDFLLGFLRLCLAASSAHKGVVSRVSSLLTDQPFRDYMACVGDAPPVKYSCLALGEFQLLYTAVKLFMMKEAAGGVSDTDVQLYHRLSLHLLCLLPPGMEYAVDNLISCVVFHPTMFPELDKLPECLLEIDLSSLSMNHPPHPLSPSLSAGPAQLSSVLLNTRDHLPSITSSLLTSTRNTIYPQHRLGNSRLLFLSQFPSSPSSSSPSSPSLRLPPYSSPLMPADWHTLPLVSLYQHSLSSGSCELGSEVVTVKNSLHVQVLLETLRVSSLSHLPPSTRLARTLVTFLIGNDVFLQPEVRPYLSTLLTVYCSDGLQQSLDLTLPIPGLSSFHNLYQSLLDQYSAVSYGDPLFSCYMLLPLQRRFPVSLRRTVWDQHSHTLRLLSLSLDQLPVKLDSFLLPPETDHQLLDLYLGALVTGSVQPQWSPVFYLIAVHHIHHFLFPEITEGDTAAEAYCQKLIIAVQHMDRKDTRSHILCYGGPATDCKLGFKMTVER